MVQSGSPSALAGAAWIGRDPAFVPEFWPPEFDDRPEITRELEPVRLLRAEFTLPRRVVSARLAITARGIYRVYLDGNRVGEDELAPGWFDYAVRIPVREHDVTALLEPGRHAIAVELADGWYAGYLGMDRRHQAGRYGTTTTAIAALTVTHDDGSTTRLVTDGSWQLGEGALRFADLLMGQFTDFTRERPGWMLPGYPGEGFEPAWCEPPDAYRGGALVPHRGPIVRVTGEVAAVAVDRRPDGRWIVDFGQNLVGRVRLRLTGAAAGDRVQLRHAEVLTPDGELYTANLRTARAHDIVVSAGDGEVFEPSLTLHGFRHVEVRGLARLEPEDIVAVVVGSDLQRVGRFRCGEPELDRLADAIGWTLRGNLVSVPTDCPQRDERLGWLGDAQVIMRTALHHYDLAEFLGKWLQDLRDGQSPSGAYPDVAPRMVVPVDGSPGWADAGVLVPWQLLLFTGRIDLVAEHRDSMVSFLDHLDRENPTGLRTAGLSRNYGDWLSLAEPTPKVLVATAYWKRCADGMAAMDRALGRDDARWSALADWISVAFRRAFLADGPLVGGTQTGAAMAIAAGLVPADLLAEVGDALAADVDARGGALTTGIHGLRDLLPALTAAGHLRTAVALLLRREYPSWLHVIRNGGTTMWERWDGWTAERGFQTPAMNSFNHYALGSVGEWLFETLGGLAPDPAAPGFGRAIVRPHPDPRIGRAGVTRRTPTGDFEVSWACGDGSLTLEVAVPPGGTAGVHVPTGSRGWRSLEIGPGRQMFRTPWSPDWVPDHLGHGRD